LAALSKVPLLGWLQIFAFAGVIETTGFFSGSSQPIGFQKDSTEGGEPGNYGTGFPNFLGTVDDAETRSTKLAAELANGRLAMVAIIGMFFQDGLTGSAWGDWALYTASPLRAEPASAAAAAAAAAKAVAAAKTASAAKAATDTAAAVAGSAGAGALSKGDGEAVAGKVPPKASFDPAKEIGAMEPLGFFDPAGFSEVGNETGFRGLRAAEIKHGRVAMMAALGAVVQHYVKFPGFEKVPAGLSAAITAPGSFGFIALFGVAGFLELSAWTEDASKEPGNFGDPVGLNMYTLEMREKEINNGRFAMFAAIGIISAELLTGKDAVEQLGL